VCLLVVHQGVHLEDLEKNIEATTQKVEDVNKDLRKQLNDKGAGVERFCVNFICCIVLLAIIGLILNTVR
jgi:t-SNARE complex subunit (syntaxin)